MLSKQVVKSHQAFFDSTFLRVTILLQGSMYDLHNTSALDDHNEHSTWSHGGRALETSLDASQNPYSRPGRI